MKRSISHKLYMGGLVPLALLAIALIVFNGLQRLADAKRELQHSQVLTATLLHAPAVDALVVGNTLAFDQLIKDVIATTPAITCVSLLDLHGRVLSQAGRCKATPATADTIDVLSNTDSLSDYANTAQSTRVGSLRVSMSDRDLILKRRQLFIQLAVSLALVLVVAAVVAHLLRIRLIRPIQQIDAAMLQVSERNYTMRLHFDGNDEISRLGLAINRTIETIAVYMRDLERRRSDADRALHEADEAALARDGLIRSMSEELEAPLTTMYSELTALAVSNKDIKLREHIKATMGLLDEVQSNLDDLLEVSTTPKTQPRASMEDFADVLDELQRYLNALPLPAGKPLHLELPTLTAELQSQYVDLDGIRLRKAVAYVLRAMYLHCTDRGVYAHMDAIPLADDQIHLSIQLKGFYPSPPANSKASLIHSAPNAKAALAALRWSDRDTTLIEYLLRAARVAVSYSTQPSGMIFVHLETVVRCSPHPQSSLATMDWLRAPAPTMTTIVSDDVTLMRFAMRSYLSHHEVKLLPYQTAIQRIDELRNEDALLLDCSQDIGDVFRLIDDLRQGGSMPPLVALCAANDLSEALETRLMQAGFAAVLPKPLNQRKLFDVIQQVVASSARPIL